MTASLSGPTGVAPDGSVVHLEASTAGSVHGADRFPS